MLDVTLQEAISVTRSQLAEKRRLRSLSGSTGSTGPVQTQTIQSTTDVLDSTPIATPITPQSITMTFDMSTFPDMTEEAERLETIQRMVVEISRTSKVSAKIERMIQNIDQTVIPNFSVRQPEATDNVEVVQWAIKVPKVPLITKKDMEAALNAIFSAKNSVFREVAEVDSLEMGVLNDITLDGFELFRIVRVRDTLDEGTFLCIVDVNSVKYKTNGRIQWYIRMPLKVGWNLLMYNKSTGELEGNFLIKGLASTGQFTSIQ